MATHVEFMQEVVARRPQMLKDCLRNDRPLLNELVAAEAADPEKKTELRVMTALVEESVLLKGVRRPIKRVFVRTHDSGGYATVGWVSLGSVTYCMICQKELGDGEDDRHNCFACGNVLCGVCCGEYAEVEEIQSLGPVRVCVQCFFGQELVQAAHSTLRDEELRGVKHEVIVPKRKFRVRGGATYTYICCCYSRSQLSLLTCLCDRTLTVLLFLALRSSSLSSLSRYCCVVLCRAGYATQLSGGRRGPILANRRPCWAKPPWHPRPPWHPTAPVATAERALAHSGPAPRPCIIALLVLPPVLLPLLLLHRCPCGCGNLPSCCPRRAS
jgi:hypothetical protein